MPQLLVRHLEPTVLKKLRRSAANQGISVEERLKAPAAAGNLEPWLIGLEAHYGDRILPVTAAIADRWGRLSPRQPLPVTDGLLAATALEHRLTLATHNTRDFLRSGALVLDPSQ